MSEDNTALDNSVNDDIDVNDEQTISSVEEQARSQGWRPKDEFEGDLDQWVDAKEFVFRGELMDRIQSQGKYIKKTEREIAQMREALQKLGEHNEKIAQQSYEKAVKTLRQQKKQAIEDGDGDAVLNIEDQLDELKSSMDAAAAATPTKSTDAPQESDQAQFDQEFAAWKASPDNSWYSDNAIMRGAADAAGIAYLEANPDASPTEVLNHVSKEVRKEFKHKFQNTQRSRTSVVDPDPNGSGTSRRSSSKKFSQRDLSQEQLQVATTFVKSGAFANVQEYVDQLAELGELPAQTGE